MKNSIQKNSFLVFVLFLIINFAFGQAPKSPISMLRYNDDFSAMKNAPIKKGFDNLKYISLGKNTFISFGGELREQYQYYDNLNFGDVPPTFSKASVGQLWHRAMVHSNLEIGSKIRVFLQLNSTLRFFNPNPLTPEIDENQLSLHQAFMDYSFSKNWMIRAGRQELGYGNHRILTFREGPNTRLTFDAAIVKYHNEKRKIDFLAITPVVSKQDVFDDESFEDYIFGVYGTENVIPKKLLVDYYVLNFNSENRKYNFVSGKENRQTFGLRIFSQNPKFNYELESTYQTGTFNQSDINAYAFSSDINYKIDQKLNLIIGLGANYASGDKDKSDTKLNTYNPIFAKSAFGLAAPIGSSNIENINPYIKINPIKKLSVYATVYFMQRNSDQDGTYSPGMTEVRPNPSKLFASNKQGIGTQYSIETSYALNKNISFAVDGAYFQAGNYVKETGKGLDIRYLSFKSTFKF
jgi:hypothetical protein